MGLAVARAGDHDAARRNLHLPVRPPREDPRPGFGPPEQADALAVETIEPGRTNRTQTFDLATGTREIRFE